jgi:hydroxymethylpyrimidine pyrophosphatase-like HAD family hydrolase
MQNRIKVIISDLDGTLQISIIQYQNILKLFFQELYNQGYLLIVAGRHHLDALPIMRALDVQST